MKYEKESCCDPAWATAGMSFNKKSIPTPSTVVPSTAPMSLSKKAVPGGETRPVNYRLDDKKI
jgi:hypothetical protein